MTDLQAVNPHDWSAPGRFLDPYSMLRELRETMPVCFDSRLHAWVLTSYEHAREALCDPRMGQVEQQKRIDALAPDDREALLPLRRLFRLWAGQSDERDHAAFTGVARPAMTARNVDRLRPRVQRIMDDLLDRALTNDEVDAVNGLAKPFAMQAIAAWLGVPTEDAEMLARNVDRIAGLFAMGTRDQLYRAQEGMLALQDYLGPIVASRRAHPREDLISTFTAADLDDQFIVAQSILLCAAGCYPTRNLLANGLQLLFEHPDERATLAADPGLLSNAVEEMVRFGGPPFSTRKVAGAPITLGGCEIQPGDSVVLVLAAANRDPGVFSDPDRFDVSRRGLNRSLGFGTTTYHCVGRPLVRMEGEVFFHTLLSRLPSLERRDPQPDWVPLPPFGRELRTLRVDQGK